MATTKQTKSRITVSITLNGKTFRRVDNDPANQPERIDVFAIHMPNARPYDKVVLASVKRPEGAVDSQVLP